jgi:hypothetical protein
MSPEMSSPTDGLEEGADARINIKNITCTPLFGCRNNSGTVCWSCVSHLSGTPLVQMPVSMFDRVLPACGPASLDDDVYIVAYTAMMRGPFFMQCCSLDSLRIMQVHASAS